MKVVSSFSEWKISMDCIIANGDAPRAWIFRVSMFSRSYNVFRIEMTSAKLLISTASSIHIGMIRNSLINIHASHTTSIMQT